VVFSLKYLKGSKRPIYAQYEHVVRELGRTCKCVLGEVAVLVEVLEGLIKTCIESREMQIQGT
jgi:hypothetical protein